MAAVDLAEDAFANALRTFEQTAFRLELQRWYREPDEAETVARFIAGSPQPPVEVPLLRDWFDQIRGLTAAGRRIERVRVHDDPPTDYQRWERWVGRWNTAAGETLRYLTRRQAYDIGLLPAAGQHDWWLLDSTWLIRMTFDHLGHRIRTELVTDLADVEQACAWRDLAVHHGVLDEAKDAAA